MPASSSRGCGPCRKPGRVADDKVRAPVRKDVSTQARRPPTSMSDNGLDGHSLCSTESPSTASLAEIRHCAKGRARLPAGRGLNHVRDYFCGHSFHARWYTVLMSPSVESMVMKLTLLGEDEPRFTRNSVLMLKLR